MQNCAFRFIFTLDKIVKLALRAWWDSEIENLQLKFPKTLDESFFNNSKAGHFTQVARLLYHMWVLYNT